MRLIANVLLLLPSLIFAQTEISSSEPLYDNSTGSSNQAILGAGAGIVINEVDADTAGTDILEFVELYDGGSGNTALDGLVLVFFNGSNNLSYNAFDLDGMSTNTNGYFVVGNTAVSGVDIVIPSNGLQNGADAVALYQDNASSFPSGSAVATTNLLDAVVYDTNDTDDAELLVLLNPGEPQLNEDTNGFKDTESNQRCPNGGGGPRNTSGFIQALATPDAGNACAPAIPDVVINEVDADTTGTDILEFVELYDGGVGSTALDGLVLVLFNGSNDLSYNAFDLDGMSTNANGYFIVGNTAVSGVDIVIPSNGLQNGADAVGLYQDDAASFPNGTAVTTINLIDAVVYDTNDADDAGLLALLNAAEPQLNEDTNGAKDTESNQRCPNGGGGPRNTSGFIQALATPDADNGCPIPVPDVVINEVDADTSGTDILEFVELYDGGTGNSPLDGFVLVLFNGSSDTSYNALDLDGMSTNANGYFVVGNTAVSGVDIVIPSNGLQNGADAVALYLDDASNFPNGTAVTTTNLIDAVVYDTNDADDAGLLALLNAAEPQLNEDTNGAKDIESNQRCPNGGGGPRNTAGFIQALATPDAANDCGSIPVNVLINETDADTAGTDILEFVELYDGGTGNSPLDGLVLVFFNGSNDSSYNAFDLDGMSTNANGYFVVGNTAVSGVDIVIPSNGLQNGADAVGLYQDDASSFPNGTAVTTTNLIDAVVYDTNDADDAGLLVLLNAAEPQLNEDTNAAKDTESNQRCPNGAGGLRNTSGYIQALATPDADNDCSSLLPNVVINEVDADTAGSDMLEFIELFDGGTGNTSLDGLSLVLFNGSSDTSYNAFDLDGFSTDANGYFVAGNTAVTGVDLVFANNGLQNGADAVGLYVADATAFPNGTAVTATGLVDAFVYDTNDTDDAGLLALLNPAQPQVNEAGNGTSATESSGRCPNGSGGFRNTNTYVQAVPTPDADNSCVLPPLSCGAPATLISAIQGNGAASGMVGSIVELEGVVVGDFQGITANGDLAGFFVQEEDADADLDAASSEGIFVFDDILGVDVNPGDVVRVEGTVAEFNGLTELMPVTNVTLCSGLSGTATPVMVTLPRATADDLEPFEGMAVMMPQTLTISDSFNAVRFGETTLSNGRLFTPTNIVAPGGPAIAQQAANNLNRLILDDARNGSYRMPFVNGQDDATPINALNPIRGGSTVSGAVGVMSFAFGNYRVRPTGPFVIDESANPRSAVPPAVGGTLRVASTNVLNFFDTIDTGGATCGPNNIGCRGADSASELIRQTDKLVAKLIGMDADIVGLVEIENNASSSLQAFVDAVNAVAGAGTYAFINTNTIGTDAIKVGIIYKPAVVTPVGAFAILDSNVDPLFIDNLNRPVLAQTFDDNNGARFTLAVNHLKSKACGGSSGADTDQGDGQACFNLTRTNAATAQVNWLATDPTGSGDSDFLIIGDLNAYAMEDPIVAIENGGYTDLIDSFQGSGNAYSFSFGGQVGYLDHALANASMFAQVTGVTEWHVNADESGNIDYNEESLPSGGPPKPADFYNADQFRAADHDPLVIGLDLAVPQVAFALATGSVGESAGSVNVTINLDSVSEQDVMVNVTSADAGATAGSDYIAVNETVVIPAGQLSNTVTVNITGDDVDEADEDLTLTLMTPQNAVLGGLVTHTLTIIDDDIVGVIVAPIAGLVTTEAGGTDSFTVVLNSQPTGNVDIGLQSDNALEGLPTPVSLQFTQGNWNQTQTVTVTGQNDGVIDGDVIYNIMVLPATGADPGYIGVDGADVQVTNINNDFAVTSFTGPTATGSGDATISFVGGGFQCTFDSVNFVPLSATAPSIPPDGFVFPHGLVEFTVSGCIAGSTLDFTIEYPDKLFVHTVYWKHAPRSAVPMASFFEFPAALNGNIAQFSISDGGLGDADLSINGIITDPSGPGVRIIETPTLSNWGLILMGLLMMGLAGFSVRRQMLGLGKVSS